MRWFSLSQVLACFIKLPEKLSDYDWLESNTAQQQHVDTVQFENLMIITESKNAQIL